FGSVRKYSKKQHCCWTCEECQPNQIIVNLTHCQTCENQYWPTADRKNCEHLEVGYLKLFLVRKSLHRRLKKAVTGPSQRCYRSFLHYIRISSWFAIFPMILNFIGIAATVGVIATLALYSETPVVRATGRELTYLLLSGCLLCYISSLILLVPPNPTACAIQRVGIGLGFAIMYASLLTKTNRLARIFDAAKKTTKRPAFISPRSQLAIAGGLVGLQFALSAIWLGFDPPSTRVDPLQPNFLVLRCAIKDSSMVTSLAYIMLLIVVCTIYAVKTRSIPENFNESRFIGFTMYTTCIIWLAFVPIYFATMNSFEIQISTLSVAVSLSATVTLVCLFAPKVYIIYFHPEKNIRKLTMNSGPGSKSRYGMSRSNCSATLNSTDLIISQSRVMGQIKSSSILATCKSPPESYVRQSSSMGADCVFTNAMVTQSTQPSSTLRAISEVHDPHNENVIYEIYTIFLLHNDGKSWAYLKNLLFLTGLADNLLELSQQPLQSESNDAVSTNAHVSCLSPKDFSDPMFVSRTPQTTVSSSVGNSLTGGAKLPSYQVIVSPLPLLLDNLAVSITSVPACLCEEAEEKEFTDALTDSSSSVYSNGRCYSNRPTPSDLSINAPNCKDDDGDSTNLYFYQNRIREHTDNVSQNWRMTEDTDSNIDLWEQVKPLEEGSIYPRGAVERTPRPSQFCGLGYGMFHINGKPDEEKISSV
ncbi:unnamed protein product, partial [Mesocestoides corti]